MDDLSAPLRTMKRIIILLLALMPIVVSAQGLVIDHEAKNVTWSEIRESNVTFDDALEYILAYHILDNVVTHNNMIAGDIVPVYLDYESAGYGRMKVPLYLSNGKFACRIILRFKEGRYMAEATDLRFFDVTGELTGRTYLYDGYGAFAFDVAVNLVLRHLTQITTFDIPSEEW